MGGQNEKKNKPVNNYHLLKMKMNEVEKSKKKEVGSSNSLKSGPSSSMNKSLSDSTSDGKLEKFSPEEKEFPPSFKKQNDDPNIPDRTYGDFYCPICDSHMNSEGMWEAHIIGKRHLKNTKKNDPDTKYEDLDVESNIKHEIKNIKEPVVGLSYIQEIRRKEVGAPPLYTCYLCQATFANAAMVIEHVITMKHRLNYIKENSRNDYDLLHATNLKKGQLDPLVEETAAKLEQKFGTGSVKVKQEKSKPLNLPSKRVYTISDDDDYDDEYPKRAKTQKHDEKNPFVWKSVGYKDINFKEVQDCREILERKRMLQYTSDEDADMYKQRDPIKRPVFNRHSRKYRASSPPSLESSKMERAYSRTLNHSPLEDNYIPYSHYPRSPPRELLKKDPYYSRNSTCIPTDKLSPPRCYKMLEKEPPISKNFPSATETQSQEDASNAAMLKGFLQKIYALPTEIFLKIVLLKLDNIEVKGIDELSMLSKVINKARTIVCNKLPADVEAIVRQKMFRNAESGLQKSDATPPLTNQIAESSNIEKSKPGTDFSFIRDFINQARGNESSLVHNTVTPHQSPHQNTTSYQSSSYGNTSYHAGNILPSNDNYSYNSAASSIAASIPGLTLTEENRQAQLYTYQAHYSGPSSYPDYRF